MSDQPLFEIPPEINEVPERTGELCEQCNSLKFTDFKAGFTHYLQDPDNVTETCDFCAFVAYLLFRPREYNPNETKRIPARDVDRLNASFDETRSRSCLRLEVINTDLNGQRKRLGLEQNPYFLDFNAEITQMSRRMYTHQMLYVRPTLEDDSGQKVACEKGLTHGMITQHAYLPRAKSWLDDCIKNHQICKGRKEKLHETTKFIDVKENKLVRITDLNEHPDFVALSYVWGPEPWLQTIKENVEEHFKQLPTAESMPQRMPKTLADAIEVTDKLGFRYLWVDALCIVQDDEKEKEHQIMQMNKIYGQASFSIVNQGGTAADSGMPGLHIPRLASREFHFLSRFTLGLWDIVTSYWTGSTGAVYGSRGWTLQEQLLARRKLIFDKNRMVFECDCGSHVENGDPTPSTLSAYRKAITAEKKDLEQLEAAWKTTKIDFSRRHLFHLEDRLNAISGITQEIMAISNEKFICGHNPEKLHNELLWKIDYDPGRDPSKFDPKATSFSTDSKGIFPTWSWLNLWPIHYSTMGKNDTYISHEATQLSFSDHERTYEVEERIRTEGPAQPGAPVKTRIVTKTIKSQQLNISAPMITLYPTARNSLNYADGTHVDDEMMMMDPPYGSFQKEVECLVLAKVNPGLRIWSTKQEEMVEKWFYGVLFLRKSTKYEGKYERAGIALMKEDITAGAERKTVEVV
ncbi:Similar to Heterokaryon incompatibility protein 6, OR allele; acc. no. Q9UV10 [Pyronema omphalodes CBS 100304]|uniref:Similar to Heterokaryon incompatibility protein 6, OR allele acc. no. Q9UV10 n=1 Tax=Pyronema omphalodes (strain CBS 100304) TaxID=1076935 RepID=U4LAE2_PYROM|nr:Similar to Heterokaryon incompatibility protein 6, OR allele; acc. no. Q9UV10 [Pyronema omphalodes CBS 100304]